MLNSMMFNGILDIEGHSSILCFIHNIILFSSKYVHLNFVIFMTYCEMMKHEYVEHIMH